jgi:hypothetical protein
MHTSATQQSCQANAEIFLATILCRRLIANAEILPATAPFVIAKGKNERYADLWLCLVSSSEFPES